MRRRPATHRCAGLTLVEVLLAVALLGSGLTILLLSVQRGIAVARRASQLETARRLYGMLELDDPVDVDEDLETTRDGRFAPPHETYTWTRTISHAAGIDIPLYEVRTEIGWSEHGRNAGETFVTLRFLPGEDGGTFAQTPQPAPAGPREGTAPGRTTPPTTRTAPAPGQPAMPTGPGGGRP